MTQALKEQLIELLQSWRDYSQPISTFRGFTDDYERGYRTGFAKALKQCADELKQHLARHEDTPTE